MERLTRLKPYLLMLALIGGLTGIRYALLPVMKFVGPVAMYFFATAVAALYGGLWLALFTSTICVLLAVFFFIEPQFSFDVARQADLTLVWIFFANAIMFGIAGEIHLRVRQRKAELLISLDGMKRAAELNERTTHALLESSSQGIFGISEDGIIRIANGAAHRMFGYEPGELLGLSIETLVDVPQRAAHARHRAAFFAAPRDRTTMHGLKLEGRHKNGSLFPIEALITVTDTPHGKMGVSFVSDITQCKAMEVALLRERSELRSLVDHTPVLVSMQDLDGRIHLINRSFANVLGKTELEIVGHPMAEIFPPQLAEQVARSNRKVLNSGESDQLEVQLRHPDGELHTYRLVKFPLRYLDTEEPFGIGGFAMDITELKRAEEKIRHAAQHDALTGLPNRALVYELGAQMISTSHRHARMLAVMFFDLDRFKPINDTYGHRVGDLMLQEVARRLQGTVRSSDLIGRLGGDEFLAVLTDLASAEHLDGIAAHLLQRLSEPYRIEALELHTSPSIGISLYPGDGTGIDTLIRQADEAMYHAKTSGRNNYQYFSDEIRRNTARVFELEQRLRRSLHKADFDLAYQPIVDMRSGRLMAVEALIRWRQPDGGELMPGDFIAAAEASGLIHQIGEWVIREACRQHDEWMSDGMPAMRIAINVSPVQFRSAEFRDRLMAAMGSSTIDPGMLELEVTESTVMSHAEESTRTLLWLKAMGLRVALDDFGTGYSSLSQLAQLPIDKLKVDRAFVTHIDSDPRSLAIAETVLTLGQKLGVEVVAEGIETQAAMSLLRDRGCDLGQGYLIGAPMRAQQFKEWQRARATRLHAVPA
jgi:diguanylate cyclase (GGDEF)-like protein/PAS domain S-box-containing protein